MTGKITLSLRGTAIPLLAQPTYDQKRQGNKSDKKAL
jgi:hypothetical protein